ncbi:MAG TPA: hypothetical protein VH062_12565 [Polyangiaceae bacterium]|jgi:hypothetical protein|nr:hypothetical protein [Polyangiaceae bacterium]
MRRHGEGVRLALLPSFAVAFALAPVAGCAGHASKASSSTTAASRAPLASGSPRPDAPPRRGLGVAVDPELELPAAVASGTSDNGLVVLTAPLDVRPALRVVADFFEAASAESPEMLERLLDRAARTRASPKARAEAALPSWRRRFDRLDYTPLSTELVYRAGDVKVHTANDAATDGAARLLPLVPKSDEILVQVFPVGQTASKLFGGELDFLLKPSSNGYKIAELVEDFRLP